MNDIDFLDEREEDEAYSTILSVFGSYGCGCRVQETGDRAAQGDAGRGESGACPTKGGAGADAGSETGRSERRNSR